MALQPVATGAVAVAVSSSAQDHDLMPPPPAKRIKRPRNVLDEETYTDAISHIIARDFFPGLLETETQQEYLDALESGNEAWISTAHRRLELLQTKGAKHLQSRQSTPRARSATPSARGVDTPRSTRSTMIDIPHSEAPAVDTNMTLDAFQSRYTSEDNESFYRLLDKQNQKKADRYAWMWRGNKLPSKMMLKQREVETKLLAAGTSLRDDGGKRDRLAIRDVDERPAKPDAWRFRPRNEFMFKPDGLDESLETMTQRAERESRAEPRAVAYGNTRIAPLAAPRPSASVPSSPSLSAVKGAIAGRRRSVDTESSVMLGSETPRVNGYAFVDDEPAEGPVAAPPLIDLGKGDAIKNPFVIKEQSRREDLHHRMVNKNAQAKLTAAQLGMTGRHVQSTVPRFPSSPRVGKPADLTPAAQRLLSGMATPKSRLSLETFDARSPSTSNSKTQPPGDRKASLLHRH